MKLRANHLIALVGAVIILFVIFAVARYRSGGTGTPVSSDGPRPVMELLTEKVDLGTIPNDKSTEFEVRFKNAGQSPLTIERISVSCPKCVTAFIPEEYRVLSPGAEGKVQAKFHPAGVLGFESFKQISIWTSDKRHPMAQVDINVKIDPEFSIEPTPGDFGEVQKGDTPEMTLRMRQMGEERIELKSIAVGEKNEGLIEARFKALPESEWTAPGKPEYDITVRLLPTIPVGAFARAIKINTTCKRVPALDYVVKAEVTSFYSVTPTILSPKGIVHPGEERIATALVTASVPFEVLNPKFTVEGLTASVRKSDDGESVCLDVSVAPDAAEGTRSGNLEFTVKSPERSVPHSMRVLARVKKSAK